MLCKGYKAVIIGIIAIELAVTVDYGIDGSRTPCRLPYLIEIRHHGLLVGNGHIDAAEVTPLQKSWELIRTQFTKLVRIGREPPVNQAGETMSELFAYESVLHSI